MRPDANGPLLSGDRWPTAPLKDVVEKLSVGLPVSRYAAKASGDTVAVPVLSVGNIEDDRIVPVEAIPTVHIPANSVVERFRLHAGDIVVSCRGTLLKSAPVLGEADGILASSNIITVRPNRSIILPQSLLMLFRTTAWQEQLKSRTRSATGLMQLTVKDLADLPVPLLPLDIQSALAELVDAEEHAYRAALDVAEKRRSLVQSLIAHALIGVNGKKNQ